MISTEQHAAIDHLEDYLERTDHKYANFREFVVLVLNEIRDLFHGESKKAGGVNREGDSDSGHGA